VSFSSPDSTPLTALYTEHHRWLVAWLRRKLGSAFDAADVAHDTYVRVLAGSQPASAVAQIREPRSYLATIANRIMVDLFRRRSLERAYLEVLAAQPEQCHPSPEARALVLETLVRIDAMLDGLGAKVKAAFLLSQLEGQSYAVIARQLALSTSTVKRYVALATEQCLLSEL
jgi:RNA polymerase sigma-70 factor (ECF subfamily)